MDAHRDSDREFLTTKFGEVMLVMDKKTKRLRPARPKKKDDPRKTGEGPMAGLDKLPPE